MKNSEYASGRREHIPKKVLFTSRDHSRQHRLFTMATVLEIYADEEVRSVIRFLWAKKLPTIEIHKELKAVYGPNVMTIQMVRKWCREFDEGRVDVTDKVRSGQPSVSDDIVKQVNDIWREDSQLSITELQETFDLS